MKMEIREIMRKKGILSQEGFTPNKEVHFGREQGHS